MDEAISSLTHGLSRCDEGAWRLFHDQYFSRLHAMAAARGGSGCDASEIVQGVYLRVLKHPKVFQDPTGFERWLGCLLRCEIIDTARGKGRRSLLNERYQQWLESRNDSCTEPAGNDLEEALLELNESEQSLVIEHYVDGWSQEQLAARHRTSTKAVESKLARLRKRLRDSLKKIATTHSP